MNTEKGLNVIVWSFDRPMQLKLCLDSLLEHFQEAKNSSISVVYKASSAQFIAGYDELRYQYQEREKAGAPKVNFIFETNFYLMTSMAFGYHPQTMFVVDDQIFFDDFSVTDPIFQLHLREPSKYFTISLRLDPTKNYCYPVDRNQAIPELKEVAPEALAWSWNGQEMDWGYVASLDGNIYHTQPIRNLFARIQPQQVTNPNAFEMLLNAAAAQGAVTYPSQNLCYPKAKTCSLPINKVQTMFDNRAESTFTAQNLLTQWLNKEIIDSENVKDQVRNAPGAHVPVTIKFIDVNAL